MHSFDLLCVSSLPPEQLGLVLDAVSIATASNPELRLTVTGPDASATLFQTSGLLLCLGADPISDDVIRRANALGLPVLAVEGGRAAELIENGRNGFLTAAEPQALADAIGWLVRRAPVRERLRAGGLLAADTRFALPA